MHSDGCSSPHPAPVDTPVGINTMLTIPPRVYSVNAPGSNGRAPDGVPEMGGIGAGYMLRVTLTNKRPERGDDG